MGWILVGEDEDISQEAGTVARPWKAETEQSLATKAGLTLQWIPSSPGLLKAAAHLADAHLHRQSLGTCVRNQTSSYIQVTRCRPQAIIGFTQSISPSTIHRRVNLLATPLKIVLNTYAYFKKSFIYLYVCAGMHDPWPSCVGQRRTHKSQFSSSHMWVSRMELRASGLAASAPTC